MKKHTRIVRLLKKSIRGLFQPHVIALLFMVFFLAPRALAQDAADLVHAGDQLYAKRSSDMGAVEKAVTRWETASRLDRSKAEPLHKIAMATLYLSRYAPAKRDRDAYLKRSLKAAKEAIEREAESAGGHYVYALTLFDKAQGLEATKFFQALPAIRTHLEQARAADPAFHYGGPDRILGIIAFRSPVVRMNDAITHLEAALKLSPTYHANLLAYADILIRRKNRREALKVLEKIQRLLPLPGDEKELEDCQAQALALAKSVSTQSTPE